jgi:fermentation-respiration switch protein FrsA (DUF1100 family)
VDAIVRGLLILAVVALVLIGYLYITQRSLLYFPSSTSPNDALLPPGARTLELETRDGLRLPAWLILPTAEPMPVGRVPAVLILNGNAGDRSYRLPLAMALVDLGYAACVFDYRGYAGNPGSPTEPGLRADALAAAQALSAQPEVDPDRIAYFGESLGAAVAGGLATELPPAALILRSPPPSVAELGRHHYPWLPVVEPLLMDRFPLADQVRELEVPLLVLVTENDEIVPAALSRRVFDAAREPKRWVALDAAHHNDPALLDGPQLLREMDAFLEEWLPRPRG